MNFTSFNFLIFFPSVIVIFYLLPGKLRWIFLLAASYFFYLNTQPVFAIVLAGITLLTYFLTRLIDWTRNPAKRKLVLVVGIVLILLPLLFLKYFNFLNEGVFQLLERTGTRLALPRLGLLLPIGISFYTLMALGYLIDVYREDIEAEKNPGIVALFLSFFPTVLSGPIERATNMFSQFKGTLLFNYDDAVKGFRFMLWGYFMKLVVADRIAILNHTVFGNLQYHNGKSLTLVTLLYPIQVYADLGGYSLIAIGAAAVMGIKVMQNFNRPFFSTSMAEFWRRWHISLISWLTDYVYLPLSFQLRKFRMVGIVISLMLTFLISGIWHGANLTFIVWGLLQGAFLSIEALMNRNKKLVNVKQRLKNRSWYIFISCVFTYLLFAFSELFGGAVESVQSAFQVIGKIAGNFSGPVFLPNKSMIIYSLFGILLLFVVEWRSAYRKSGFSFFHHPNAMVRRLTYAFLAIVILLIGVFDGGQFIYFQF